MSTKLFHRRDAFTLVELLVVIGIIAVLISILLPALSKAREKANTVKCAANLRSVGQGIAAYIAQYKQALPPSNFYKGLTFDSVTGQLPTTPSDGYVHWSSFIYGDQNKAATDGAYTSVSGWEAFQCPSLPNGGLPPANTYAGNNEGLDNEAGAGVIDWQAPRLAYTVNEALCPRGIFQKTFRGANRPYHFVKAGRVSNSGGTILATEIWGTQAAAQADSLVGGGPASNSRRPVSGYVGQLTSPDSFYTMPIGGNFKQATAADIDPDPEANPGASSSTTLSFVGRNHDRKTKGQNGTDLRRTNFLYLDGHVETKHIRETVSPNFEWGEKFYTLEQ